MLVGDGIHRIEAPLGDRYIAMYLIVGDDCSALVDTGIAPSIADTLVPYLTTIDHPIDRIRWVVNTHADFDHIGGNAALKARAPDAQFVCGAADRALVEDVERLIDERYGEFRQEGFDETSEAKQFIRSVTGAVSVDGTLDNGHRIDLGGRMLECLAVPGHSDGHLALYDEATDAALIGDAVLSSSVLRADGGPAFPPTYRDVTAYRSTIARLRHRGVGTLLTSHFAVARDGDVRRFLDVSESFTATVESEVLRILSEVPLTLLEIVERAAPALGQWTPEPALYLVYPILGHLEHLAREGLAHRLTRPGKPTTWTQS